MPCPGVTSARSPHKNSKLSPRGWVDLTEVWREKGPSEGQNGQPAARLGAHRAHHRLQAPKQTRKPRMPGPSCGEAGPARRALGRPGPPSP